MQLSDDVMNDLLTVYLAGAASAETRALVEARAQRDPAFAERIRVVSSAGVPETPGAPPPRDQQLAALTRTREFIRLRTLFTAAGILFTLLPLVFAFDRDGVEFLILGRHPGLVWAFWSLAAASWVATWMMHRSIRHVGL
jgi:hypothetical protein